MPKVSLPFDGEAIVVRLIEPYVPQLSECLRSADGGVLSKKDIIDTLLAQQMLPGKSLDDLRSQYLPNLANLYIGVASQIFESATGGILQDKEALHQLFYLQYHLYEEMKKQQRTQASFGALESYLLALPLFSLIAVMAQERMEKSVLQHSLDSYIPIHRDQRVYLVSSLFSRDVPENIWGNSTPAEGGFMGLWDRDGRSSQIPKVIALPPFAWVPHSQTDRDRDFSRHITGENRGEYHAYLKERIRSFSLIYAVLTMERASDKATLTHRLTQLQGGLKINAQRKFVVISINRHLDKVPTYFTNMLFCHAVFWVRALGLDVGEFAVQPADFVGFTASNKVERTRLGVPSHVVYPIDQKRWAEARARAAEKQREKRRRKAEFQEGALPPAKRRRRVLDTSVCLRIWHAAKNLVEDPAYQHHMTALRQQGSEDIRKAIVGIFQRTGKIPSHESATKFLSAFAALLKEMAITPNGIHRHMTKIYEKTMRLFADSASSELPTSQEEVETFLRAQFVQGHEVCVPMAILGEQLAFVIKTLRAAHFCVDGEVALERGRFFAERRVPQEADVEFSNWVAVFRVQLTQNWEDTAPVPGLRRP